MAVTNTCIRFFLWAKLNEVSFNNTLTLGHLENLASKKVMNELANKHPELIDLNIINWKDKFADSIFKALGASYVDSLDFSDYEKANIVHDLNEPIPTSMYNKYSVVVDGGTLEHVFNFPQAISSCKQSLQTNGHFIGFSPANNLMGHGFYQFSPEIFYRVFSEENGFKLKGIFLVAADFSIDTEIWYKVTDPSEVGDRVTLQNNHPTYLMILAQKQRETNNLKNIFQSDYKLLWNQLSNGVKPRIKKRKTLIQRIIHRFFPIPKEENLEQIEPTFFKRTNAGKK